jgi:PAS domain S-box-containing protein
MLWNMPRLSQIAGKCGMGQMASGVARRPLAIGAIISFLAATMKPLPPAADPVPDYRHALTESHARLTGILKAALDCIVTVDAENRIIEFNPAAEKTFGYVEREVIGKDMTELVIPPAFRDRHRMGMRRYLESGETRVLGRRIEITAMRADRSEFPCELTITHLQIEGRPVFTAFLRDITERKKAEEDVQRLNANLEQQVAARTEELRASIATLEQTRGRLEEAQAIGRIGDVEVDIKTGRRVWSAQVFQLYAFPAAPEPPPLEEVIARVHPSDQPAFRQFLDVYQHSDTENALEYRVIRMDGSIVWLMMRARVRQRPGLESRVLRVTVQDITQRKTLERELLATIDKERELGRLKTSFLQMVTHEYRTPLGIITSSAQILEKYFDRLEPAQRQEQLQGIRLSARNLANLLEEVLFLGKTDSGVLVLQPEPVDLAKWLRLVADDVVAGLGAERVVTVATDGVSGLVMLDERLLRHAMNNLVSNALKYSTLDKPVAIGARAEDGWLVLSVRDRGIGIPAADRQKLFHMFQRASNVGTISGSGLGLVIVKRCIDLHGGTIELRDAPGGGTEVVVRLPRVQPSARTPQSLS